MNFEEFYKRLTNIYNSMDAASRKNTKVSIPVDRGFASVGGRQKTDIKSVSNGIDWDRGKIFVHPEERVNIVSERTKVSEKFLNDCVDSLATSKMFQDKYSKRGLTDAIKRHFQSAVDELGIEEELDKMRSETIELQKKAKEARLKARKEKDSSEPLF